MLSVLDGLNGNGRPLPTRKKATTVKLKEKEVLPMDHMMKMMVIRQSLNTIYLETKMQDMGGIQEEMIFQRDHRRRDQCMRTR